MLNNKFYLMLLIAQMALEGISTATISYFTAVYPSLVEHPYLNCLEMGELAHMSGVAAGKHMQILRVRGYVTRRHSRAWTLSDRLLKNPDLISLLRVSNGLI